MSTTTSTSSSTTSTTSTSTTSQGCPVPQNCVKVLSSTQYTDSLGATHVVGEVQNQISQNLDSVVVAVTFYAADGKTLETDSSLVLMSILTPSQKSPFDVYTLNQNLGNDHYTVAVTDASVTSNIPYANLAIQGPVSQIQSGFYHVTGQIANTGTNTANSVEVVVTLYDTGGKVVAVALSPTTPPVLHASETGSFDAETDSNVNSIASFAVQVQSS